MTFIKNQLNLRNITCIKFVKYNFNTLKSVFEF